MNSVLYRSNVILDRERKVLRHSLLTQLEHWAVAASGLLLLFTGFGQLPIYKRYMIDRLPGLSWVSDFIIQLNLHMAAGIVFTFAVIFHLVNHYATGGRAALPRKGDVIESVKIILAMIAGKKEPPSHKFLAEQRLAYFFIGSVSLLLIATGLLKVIETWSMVHLPFSLLFWNTMLHNVGTVLFLLGFFAHMGALVMKANWPLFASMFHRKVALHYAEERHPLWVEEIKAGRVRNRVSAKTAARLIGITAVCTTLILGLFFSFYWLVPAVVLIIGLVQRRWNPLAGLLGRLGYE
jgi:cytochrome b subunit of formate dehydrogenase